MMKEKIVSAAIALLGFGAMPQNAFSQQAQSFETRLSADDFLKKTETGQEILDLDSLVAEIEKDSVGSVILQTPASTLEDEANYPDDFWGGTSRLGSFGFLSNGVVQIGEQNYPVAIMSVLLGTTVSVLRINAENNGKIIIATQDARYRLEVNHLNFADADRLIRWLNDRFAKNAKPSAKSGE